MLMYAYSWTDEINYLSSATRSVKAGGYVQWSSLLGNLCEEYDSFQENGVVASKVNHTSYT